MPTLYLPASATQMKCRYQMKRGRSFNVNVRVSDSGLQKPVFAKPFNSSDGLSASLQYLSKAVQLLFQQPSLVRNSNCGCQFSIEADYLL